MSYVVTFIPGLPRPLVLSEVIDDVMGLASFPTRHSVRKLHGAPDRIDVVVGVDSLAAGLDHAAGAAQEITRIGESLLGLGFVLDERSVRVDGLDHGWLPETFGAGARPRDPTRPATDALPVADWADDDLGADPDHPDPGDGRLSDDDPRLEATEPSRVDDRRPVDDDPRPDAEGRPRADDDARLDAGRRPRVHDGVRLGADDHLAHPDGDPRRVPAAPAGLLAVALVAVVAPWWLAITPVSIAVAGLVALLVAGATAVCWVRMPGRAVRVMLTGTATLALVLAFATAYAVAARSGDLRRAPAAATGATARPGPRVATFGHALSASVSVGAAPGLTVSGGAARIAYVQRLLLLALLTTVLVQGALIAPRAVREARMARLGVDEVRRRTEAVELALGDDAER